MLASFAMTTNVVQAVENESVEVQYASEPEIEMFYYDEKKKEIIDGDVLRCYYEESNNSLYTCAGVKFNSEIISWLKNFFGPGECFKINYVRTSDLSLYNSSQNVPAFKGDPEGNGDVAYYDYECVQYVNCEETLIGDRTARLYENYFDMAFIADEIKATPRDYCCFKSNGTFPELYLYVDVIIYDKTYNSVKDEYTYTISERYKSNYISFRFDDAITYTLETVDNLTYDEIFNMQYALDLNLGYESSITVNYIKMSGANGATSYAKHEAVSEIKTIPSEYLQNKNRVLKSILGLYGANDISYFDAKYNGYYYDSEAGGSVKTEERIVRRAKDCTYTYNNATSTGVLTIVYSDFGYNDVFLRVTNNEPNNLLALDVYSTNVSVNNDTATLSWSYASIESQLYNKCKWLFDLGPSNVSATGINEGVLVDYNALLNAGHASNVEDDFGLTVTFSLSNQEDLFGLNLVAVAVLVQDIDYTVNYEYVKLDNNLVATTVISPSKTMLYSEFIKMYESQDLFNNYFPDAMSTINSAISPNVLNGEPYYVYNTITLTHDYDNAVGYITVHYDKNVLVEVKDNLGVSMTKYKALKSNSAIYTPEELNFELPSGYRCYDIKTLAGYYIVSNLNLEDFSETKIDVTKLLNKEGEIIPIVFQISDKWNIEIRYLQNYVNSQGQGTPFAKLHTYEGEVKVADYGENLRDLTLKDILTILELKTLKVLKSDCSGLHVVFNGSKATYYVTCQYTSASINQIDYNGYKNQLSVPLIPYQTYCELYGSTWDLTYLNTDENVWFKYPNEVSGSGTNALESNQILYGYFGQAIFQEREVELNKYFKNNTGSGCQVFHESVEIKGNVIYQFIREYQYEFALVNGISGAIGGTLGAGLTGAVAGFTAGAGATYALERGILVLCEFNDSDAGSYYSKFFYIDGTSDKAFLSNGGADYEDDEDSAVDNWADNIFGGSDSKEDSKIDNFFDSVLEFFEQIWEWLKWVLIGLAGLFVVGVLLRIFKFILR